MNWPITFTTVLVLLAPGATAARADDRLPAFPGAEGFGAESVGGRGGRVIKVTNLGTRGPGSLQAACNAEGPRIVVFDVSGIIPGNVVIEHGRISIMGQTAPGAGVTIEGMLSTRFNSPQGIDDVVVRYLRVRPTCVRGSGGDAIQFSQARRVILDHLSCSWACDETIDIYSARDVTVQWCSIEESAVAGHPKGRHNYGLFFNNGTRIGSTSPYPDDVNYVRGGQIPLLNNSPIIVMRDGKFYLSLGTPGGETIGQTQFQVLLNILDFDMGIQEAIEAPRFCLNAKPNFYKLGAEITMRAEGRVPSRVLDRLKQLGHRPQAIDCGIPSSP